MPSIDINAFIGLDTRPGKLGANIPGFIIAENVSLVSGGAMQRRPVVRAKAVLHEESVGLYARGAYLRTIVPGGHSFQDDAPSGIIYDPIGYGIAAYPTGKLAALLCADTYGTTSTPTTSLSGTASAIATAAQTVFTTAIAWATGYTTDTVLVIVDDSTVPKDSVTVANVGGFLRLTIPAQSAGAVVKVYAFRVDSGTLTSGPNAVVLVRRSDNQQVELHYLKNPAALSSIPVATRVAMPFQPGAAFVKLDNKLWVPNQTAGAVGFSSSVNGPSDFTTVGDAGFLPTGNHVAGNQTMVGVSHHRGRLAVLFNDAIQLWRVGEDPNEHAIEQVFQGPGAMLAGASVNMKGDLVYLSRGGFRNLAQVALTGESDEREQMGNPIRSLTDALGTATPATALWSQRRNQYLCAIGTTVYAFTFLPGDKLEGWTTWELPIDVDHLVEKDGELYARAGDTLYEFLDGETTDEGGAAVAVEVESRPFLLNKGRNAELMWLLIRQRGEATWQMIVDGVRLLPRLYPSCPDAPIRIPLAGQCRQVAFRVTAETDWRLDGMSIEYERIY